MSSLLAGPRRDYWPFGRTPLDAGPPVDHARSGEGEELSELDGNEVLRLREAALPWRLVDGEIVALDLARSVYLTANESGALLWAALASGATREELARVLVDAFELDAEDAAKDVDAFLAEAADRDLLA